jgi:hypothetical protein
MSTKKKTPKTLAAKAKNRAAVAVAIAAERSAVDAEYQALIADEQKAAETPPTSRRKLLKGETPPSTEAASVAAAKPKPKKEKKPKKAPAEMVRVEKYIVEHWEKCRTIAAEIEALQAEYNGLRETAKEIKEAAAGKSSILRRMNSRGPERLPLFDEPPKPTTAAPSTPTAAAPVAIEGAAPAADADAWKAAPLRESLHKPGKTALNKSLDVLTKKGIDTIGKLEDLRASGGGYRKWQDAAKGVGDEGAEAVTDAVLAWLTKHRDAAVFAAAAPPKAADAKTDAGPTLPPKSVPALPKGPKNRKKGV